MCLLYTQYFTTTHFTSDTRCVWFPLIKKFCVSLIPLYQNLDLIPDRIVLSTPPRNGWNLNWSGIFWSNISKVISYLGPLHTSPPSSQEGASLQAKNSCYSLPFSSIPNKMSWSKNNLYFFVSSFFAPTLLPIKNLSFGTTCWRWDAAWFENHLQKPISSSNLIDWILCVFFNTPNLHENKATPCLLITPLIL